MFTESGKLRPWGITALIIFFLAGAAISLTASISLLFPNSFLESMWRRSSRARESLKSRFLGCSLIVYCFDVLCGSSDRTMADFKVGVLAGSRVDRN